MTSRPGRRGVTLIEMVVVLVICGIVSAAVVPAIARGESDDPLELSSAEAVAMLRRARATAMERGVSVTVRVDGATARYSVRMALHREPAIAEGVLKLAEGASIVADSVPPRFGFSPTGAAWGRALVIQAGGRATTVSVDRWTGSVSASTP